MDYETWEASSDQAAKADLTALHRFGATLADEIRRDESDDETALTELGNA